MSGTATVSVNGKPPRRFPPPCWTQEEALALIQAYRNRWYALRRGYLRTADWDAVAEDVGRMCPGATPPKTSAQCRHKMEKLRQRYRAEKQRAVSFPGGRFVSNWFYFQAIDSMERNDDIVFGAGSGSGIVTLASRANSSSSSVRVVHEEENDNVDDELEDAYYDMSISKNVGRTSSLYPPKKFSKTSWNGNDDWVKMPYGEGSGGSEERDDGDALGQIVSSIKDLADGFMKMEKMKMDVAHEIEKMRMEAEMKRNEMLLESQRQLVDMFVKGLAENKK